MKTALRILSLCCLLALPKLAEASCDTGNPFNTENDCDFDGCKVGQGDCNDSPDGGNRAKGSTCPGGAIIEMCDGIDNNCAGGPDEGMPDAGLACTKGLLGVCNAGTTACTSGQIVCNQNVASSPERCNNLDDNCNGTTDEGNPDAGTACTSGLPGICSAGVRQCQVGVVNCVPNFTVGQRAEVCNALDDNCNGNTDEGFNVNGACTSSNPGICAPGTLHCAADAGTKCDSNIAPNSQSESCNNLDDNCNGSTDEGNPGGGASCPSGQVGVCAAGTRQCIAGNLNCVPIVMPNTQTDVCDALDNDCDGMTDEGFNVNAACSTGQQGICSAGTNACAADGGVSCNRTQNPRSEMCNNLDDNCNGQTDENNPDAGGSCSSGLPGICSPGIRQCQFGSLNCVANVMPNTVTETCNNLDDNCNGSTDEGFGAGGTCTSTNVGVCQPGTLTCQMNGTVLCVSNVMPNTQMETCDNKDNDCDGMTDEGNPGSGASCVSGSPGVCSAGHRQCLAGGSLTCVPDITPGSRSESCNGLDDDCNGVVDNGFGVGGACTSLNVGVCAPGTQLCQADGGIACVSNVLPGARSEMCNNLDDNCNGSTDEGNPDAGSACSSGLQGVCSAGTRQCQAGGVLACVATIMPNTVTEVCNNLDDNCAGGTDEGFGKGNACATGLLGRCAAGTVVCATDAGTRCNQNQMPASESCNGIDDNCNGNIDDGDPGGGATCNNSGLSGVCANGIRHCVDAGIRCVANIMPGMQTEICNGLDDNCNSQVDEGFGVNGACTSVNVGVCAPGTFLCQGNGTVACVSNVTPGSRLELCNGLDDDCDGQTDEGNPDGGVMCNHPTNVGICRPGLTACMSGAIVCNSNIQPSTRTEVCNNQDDNCNGTTDEGFGTGGTCTSGLPGVCSVGTQLCQADAGVGCVANVQPNARMEMCNGLDDNCNGTTDEGNPDAGASCTSGLSGVCSAGTRQCQSGTLACVATIMPNTQAEICDTKDNNCNGMTDEGLGLGMACTNPAATGVCTDGLTQCVADGGTRCVSNINPGQQMETCDNKDNNCNGMTDESLVRFCWDGGVGTFDGGCPGPNCSLFFPGPHCAIGQQTCGAGAWGQCQGQVGPSTETCDQADNDCDGRTDNGLIVNADNDPVRKCGTCGAPAAGLCDCDDTNKDVYPGKTEFCNGLDDNCNGQLDENGQDGGKISNPLGCYTGPVATRLVGECTDGFQFCASAPDSGVLVFGVCTGEKTPVTEACDLKDNNCDGRTDEGFDVDNDGFLSCSACPGRMNCDCNDSNKDVFPGAVEKCDMVDDNCDGHLDDVPSRRCFAGMFVTPDTYTNTCPGPMCTPKGVCVAGTQTCSAAGAWGACAGETLPGNDPAGPELTCNHLDDDCDGVTDDGNFDVDMDGVTSCQGDCNDNDNAIKPGSLEVCDNKDNDCDGVTDGANTGCYSGPMGTVSVGECKPGIAVCSMGQPSGACMGEIGPTAEACNGKDDDCDGKTDEDFDVDMDGVVSCSLCPGMMPCDCDDADRFNKPGAPEICDCKDNNCNTTVDEGGVCVGAPCHDFDQDGYTNCQGDCNDTMGAGNAINPGRSEVWGNNVDDDCDGAVDEDTDEDGDGYSTKQGDCDDHFASVRPNAVEVCDGFDNNCNGMVDEGFDQDHDYATTCAGDCDDTNAGRSPFITEICGNQVDDNCDNRVDEDADLDGDGVSTCQGDCNDHQATVHPAQGAVSAAPEICDGQDNNCNAGSGGEYVDEGFDMDHDGYTSCFGDCNDNDANANPGKYEVPGNSIDDNCNGQTDEGTVDSDQDGFSPICGDCNDRDPSINPQATEICDRVDNNCDAYIDSAAGNYNLCAVCFDADGDGQTNCDGDCNDADKDIYRGAAEVCDTKDNDCDGNVDLDPNTGLRVCVNDGGMGQPDGGPDDVDAGDAGGPVDVPDSGMEMMMDADGGMHERPIVATGCGCQSTEGALPLALLIGAFALLRRKKLPTTVVRAAPLLALLVLFAGCPSVFHAPNIAIDPDGGTASGGGDAAGGGGNAGGSGGSGGGSNAGGGGSDAGIIVQVPLCPEIHPVYHEAVRIPGTTCNFARSLAYTLTTKEPQQLLVLDDAKANVGGFVLRRALPSDIDPTDPGALEALAAREVAALDSLPGTPLVRDRVERFSRAVTNPTTTVRTFSTAQTIALATDTNAFSLRNRLITALSGKTPVELGALPVVPGSLASANQVIYLMFRITQDGLFIAGAVSPAESFAQNQPALNDLTNGSHISAPLEELNYTCEIHNAPAVKTDFIFIVDNSGSMVEEQAALADAAQGLFEAFTHSGLDFRVGVVTTDSDVLQGQGFTTDLNQFKSDVHVGINGNSIEMGIEYGLRAIQRGRMQTDPKLRIRDDAGLVVVVVSDEENAGLRSLADYATAYNAEKAVVFAIVGPRPAGCARVGLGRANAGTEYIDLATKTGGSAGSICNPNLTEVIEEVLFGAQGASSHSQLTLHPISGSLTVKTTSVLARARSNGFDYDPVTNTILFFGAVPSAGADFQSAFAYFQPIQ